MEEKKCHAYDDIIDLPHHVSETRQRMSMNNRAAQFSPFAALTGHKDAVEETERLTQERVELSSSRKEELGEKLFRIMECDGEKPKVSVTYFEPDGRKEGGSYRTLTGRIKKADGIQKQLVMADGVRIPMEDIVELEEAAE